MLKITLCFFFLITAVNAQEEQMSKSNHFDPKTNKFFNPEKRNNKGFGDLLKWLTSREKSSWPNWVENEAKPKPAHDLNDHQMAITFINHASFLIQYKGINILTDPVYSERTSPVSFAGPKRVRAVGLPFEKLPPIDLVAISHNHYDHMDLETLKKLEEKFHPLFLIPLGDAKLLKDEGIQNIIEQDWWDKYIFKKNFKVTFTPAQHFSGRGLFDRNKSLWGGYIFEYNGHRTFFAGDTGYAGHFKQIKQRFGQIDLSFLPIGAYRPEWFMQTVHVNPEQAVMAHQDLGSKKSIAMHFGTFQLSDEGIDEPVVDLHKALKKANIESEQFLVLKVGQTLKHSFAP